MYTKLYAFILLFIFLIVAQTQAITFLETQTDIAPATTGSWQTVDISAYVPANASGIVYHYYHSDSYGGYFGIRNYGSTDNRVPYINDGTHHWGAVGCASQKVNITVGHANMIVLLVGYFINTEAVFFVNGVDVSLTTTEAWTDIDNANVPDGSLGVIIEIYCNGGADEYFGLRKNGSTDDRTTRNYYYTTGKCSFIGVDESGIFEGYVSSTATDFYIQGYFTASAQVTFNTNATDVSIATTGSYTNLSALPEGAIAGIYEIATDGGQYYCGMRKDGDSDDIYAYVRHTWSIVEANAGIVEQKIAWTAVDTFLVGYFTEPIASNVKSVSGVSWDDLSSFGGVSRTNIRSINGIFPDEAGRDANNSFYTTEFEDQGAWSNSGSWAIESEAMKLPHNVTSADTATIVADKDWIAYCRLKTTKTADFYAEYKIGSADEIKIAVDYDYADSVAELGTLSLYVASTGYTLATGLDTDNWVDVVIHFDDKNDCVNIFTKESNQYTFLGGYNMTAITGSQNISFATANAGTGDRFLWVDFISICYPNLMSIGDSITAGANYFNPDPDVSAGNDPYNNCYQSYINITDDDDRNTLVVNKGVGSQTTAQFLARLATDIIAHYPRLVIIQASDNDAMSLYTDTTKLTQTQSMIDTIHASLSNTKIVMLSVCVVNENYIYGDYEEEYPIMTAWNEGEFLTLTNVDAFYQCNTGFSGTSDQEADGVHPKASGYEKIGNGLETLINEITW